MIRYASVLVLLLVSACGQQREGERCDRLNGDADCESALVCVEASKLSQIEDTPGAALCCPPPGQTPSVDACNPSSPLDPTANDAGS